MAEVGSAWVSVLPSAKGFGRKLESGVGGELSSSGRRMGSALGSAIKVGALAAIGGAVLATKFLKGAVDEAREAQVVTARTENVIETMGNAAKVSAGQVAELAGAISVKTGIDDEAIQSGQNMLLTFGNIRNEVGKGNDIFNQASQTMVDYAAVMEVDAKGAAVTLGKALNDPIKGLTSLGKAGVQFTEGQKETIKSLVEQGNVMGAQKIILGELKRQFGGAAEAMATPAEKAQTAWANFKEEIGTRLLPIVDKVLTKFVEVLPTVLGWVDKIGPTFTSIVDAITPVVTTIRDFLQPVLDGVSEWIQANPDYLKAFGIALGVVAGTMSLLAGATTVFAAALSATGLPLLIIGIAALVAGLIVAYQKSETFRSFVDGLVESFRTFATYVRDDVLPMLQDLGDKVRDHLKPVWDQLVDTFKKDILPTVQDLIDKFREWRPAIQKAAEWVLEATVNMVDFGTKVLGKVLPPLIEFAGFIFKRVIPAIATMIEHAVIIASKMVAFGKAVADRAADFARFIDGLRSKMAEAVSIMKALPGRIKAALGNLASMLVSAGYQIIQGLINGIRSAASGAANAARDAVQGAISAATSALGIKSPSRVFLAIGDYTMQGFAKGIKDGADEPADAMGEVVKKLRERLETELDKLRSTFDTLKSEFASLRDGIASSFTGNLFEGANAFEFMNKLTNTRYDLTQLKAAFKKLRGWGMSPEFLSQLFSSGNSGLILDLAAGPRSQARQSQALFGEVNALGASLGTAVAQNDLGPEIRGVRQEIRDLRKDIAKLPRGIGREINGAATRGQKDRRVA